MQKGQKTLQEVMRQPSIWEAVWNDREHIEKTFRSLLESHRPEEIIVTGCGTSHYLSQSAAAVLAHFLHIPTRAVPSSELFLFPNAYLTGKRTLVIAVSRSGMTTETVKAVEVLKRRPEVVALAVSCYADSDLCLKADACLVSQKAQEESVVMTGSFSSMLYIVILAALSIGGKELLDQASTLAEAGGRLLPKMDGLAKDIMCQKSFSHFIYLGSGPNYGLSQEAMLKIKEMAIVTSEGYHSLEFRHGPKSIVDDRMLISMFVSDSAKDYETALLKELKGLGGVTLAICDGVTDGIKASADYVMDIACGLSEWVRLPLYIVQAQLLAFYLATEVKGIDPDSPQNLTQVVML